MHACMHVASHARSVVVRGNFELVLAGGYMSTIFWQDGVTAEEAAFGTVVSTNLLAPLHDHFAGESKP